MSGPKVMRIVTRDELIAICKGHLTALSRAIQEWTEVCQRHDPATEGETAATIARQTALAQLLTQDRFLELQKAVPTEIAFLKSDQEARLERAAAKRANALANQRRTKAAAAAVLTALDQKGKIVPDELRSSLEQIAAGHANEPSAISRAFTLLSDSASTISEHQRKLAEAHDDNLERQSFAEWLAQSNKESDDEFARLELRLAELTVFLGEIAITDFQKRLRSLASENPSHNRSLIIDSLELDLAQAVSHARKRQEIEVRLKTLAAQLSEIDSEETQEWSQTILAKLDRSTEILVELETKAAEILATAIRKIATKSKRQAVLRGLTELGYQVSEGMETAWVQDGKIVLKRRLDTGYGVEIIGNIDSGRVQMRTVAFRKSDTAADKSKDKAAETTFCSDVSKLQEGFAEEGSQIVIERAEAIGATPLKTISPAEAGQEEFRERIPPSVQQRSLK